MTPQQLRAAVLKQTDEITTLKEEVASLKREAHRLQTERDEAVAKAYESSRISQEAALRVSKETSFYWRVIARIGEAVGVTPKAGGGDSLDRDWRQYASDVQACVCSK